MPIFVVPDVNLEPQDKRNACWYFSGKMVASWSRKSKRAVIKDPSIYDDLRNLYTGDCGWALSTCKTMANKLGMKAVPRKQRDYNEMFTLLQAGPIWTAGMKTVGAESFPHVVVIAGVADTGVLVLDPLPEKQGERDWKTWSWLSNFLDLNNSTFDANLLVV